MLVVLFACQLSLACLIQTGKGRKVSKVLHLMARRRPVAVRSGGFAGAWRIDWIDGDFAATARS